MKKTWLIDADILIERERGNPAFERWSKSGGQFATADIVRGQFLYGVAATKDLARRKRGEKFYFERIGATVATRNLKDFSSMGCPCENPLK
ncbi:MAG TPA: hypothetical protein VFM25_09510 [Verrucomicrobiae bacterium]|nr:hypothetical protein [Verrucomicrobiae bacterium]